MDKDKARLSLPESRKVCGGKYEVRRRSFGAFLDALVKAEDLAADMSTDELARVLAVLKVPDMTSAAILVVEMARKHCGPMIGLVSALSEIPVSALRDDPGVGLDGIAEILTAVLEVNHVADFFQRAERIRACVLMPGSRS